MNQRGIRLPFGEELIEFSIDGPGEIIGLGSARPNSVESFQQMSRTTFEGRCIAIVKSTGMEGDIEIRASSGTLVPALQTITAR